MACRNLSTLPRSGQENEDRRRTQGQDMEEEEEEEEEEEKEEKEEKGVRLGEPQISMHPQKREAPRADATARTSQNPSTSLRLEKH